ncbi:hypothetical protein ACX9R5_06620 [Rathayibacter sp. CAU 1779]
MSNALSGLIATVIVVVPLVAVFVVPIWIGVASSRRARRQSVSISNGTVFVTDSAYGRPKAVPSGTIGTVVYLPERGDRSPKRPAPTRAQASAAAQVSAGAQAPAGGSIGRASHGVEAKDQEPRVGNGTDMFRNGGLIILDTGGRMVGHVAYEIDSHAPLGTVWRQIPALDHVQAPLNGAGTGYSRSAFKRAFPKALRFGQLWTSAQRTWTVLGLIFIGIPVLAFVALFASAFVATWNEMHG